MRVNIMCDSGAFTAWTKCEPIEILNYIEFIKANSAHIETCVNVDVIPGQDGEREHRAEVIAEAAAASRTNLQLMKRAGLAVPVVPVFHMDEDFDVLKVMLDDGEEYIGLSPCTRAPPLEIMGWLYDCFSILTQSGRPLVRTHGFGLSSPLLCLEFPWTSADSATWAKSAGNGKVLIPPCRNGKPAYALEPQYVALTDRLRWAGPQHIDDADESTRLRVDQFLNDEVGVTLDQARSYLSARYLAWIRYLQGLEAACALRHGSQFRIYFATDTTPLQHEVLNQAGVQHRLVSYHRMKNLPDCALGDYVAGRVRAAR
jgi:hypothetical protein